MVGEIWTTVTATRAVAESAALSGYRRYRVTGADFPAIIATGNPLDQVDGCVYAKLDDPDEGLNDISIRDLYDHVIDCFAKISQCEIDTNLASFNEGINLSKTLAVYT